MSAESTGTMSSSASGLSVSAHRDTLDRRVGSTLCAGSALVVASTFWGFRAGLQPGNVYPSSSRVSSDVIISRYEVDREEKIGIGFFSSVYPGTWRQRTVAIKVLAPCTPRSMLLHEVGIWKGLAHPNVLEL
jgi:abelson tyrosine-protein kinase 1